MSVRKPRSPGSTVGGSESRWPGNRRAELMVATLRTLSPTCVSQLSTRRGRCSFVTAEIVDGPPRPRKPLAAVPEPAVAADAGPHWRAVARRSALVPLVVLSPLVTLTPAADHRFNIYA